MKSTAFTLAVLILATVSLLAQAQPPRHALVMGVGDYGGATYKGRAIANLPGITTADLPHMATKLRGLGFTVTVVENPTLAEARQAVDVFSARIKAAPGVSLFYFSGHGGEYEGKNFLIPKRASIGSKADLADEALNAQRVLNGMEESGAPVNLIFLDCCREDLGKSVGGAEMAPLKARGSFIGFATRSGDFADPEAQGSPYTRFLLKHLDKPGVSVADMYSSVIADVRDYSKRVLGEERRPGFYSELDAPFYFVPASFGKTTPPLMPAQPSVPVAPPANVLDAGAVGKEVAVKLPGQVEMKLCYIPPGSFTMGSPASEKDRGEDERQVPVRITKGFWMARTELTQAQWTALMGTTIHDMALKGSFSKEPKGIGPTHPMHFVTWEDAQACIAKLNATVSLPAGWKFALPTEAQWEYACRAGKPTVFSFGDSLTSARANFDSRNTVPVGSYSPNDWGLCDMHGNVWEWCADYYEATLAGGPDPEGPKTGVNRVYRGGGGGISAAFCRAAFRGSIEPGSRDRYLGFRPALVPSR